MPPLETVTHSSLLHWSHHCILVPDSHVILKVGHMIGHVLHVLTFEPAVTAKSRGSTGEKCTLVTAADSFATTGNCRQKFTDVGPVMATCKKRLTGSTVSLSLIHI